MVDAFDIMAFVVFGVLLAATVIVIVTFGSLPGSIAAKRGHPQAAAITATGWLGIATGGLLWPIALIWAFLKPLGAIAVGPTDKATSAPDAKAELLRLQARVEALETALRELGGAKEVAS